MATTIRNELDPIPTDWRIPEGGLILCDTEISRTSGKSPPWRSCECLPRAESVSYAERSNIPNTVRFRKIRAKYREQHC
jgi:hypothetical protein